MSSNQLKTIPGEFSSLVSLTELNLSDNVITELPSSMFATLTKLKILSLYVNRLSGFPVQLAKCLTGLEGLELSNNQITNLPRDFGNMTSLKRLKLSSNPLAYEALEKTIPRLTNLEVLAIEHLKLECIPPQIAGLKNLKKFFYKAGNPLNCI